MAASTISYELAPPFSLPLRFFLTAPLFAAAAGGVVCWQGAAALDSRWSSATLAVTHLLTLGFMLMVMLGALIQTLPVVLGVQLRSVGPVAATTHLGLSLGAILLPAAFLAGVPTLFIAAGLVLGGVLLVFLVFSFLAMRTSLESASGATATATPSQSGVRLSLAGLAVTAGLGVALALGFARGWSLPYAALADLHAAWGLAAWVGMLLAALSYVVVPMFQMTPPYPPRLQRVLPRMMLLGLLLWSLSAFVAVPQLLTLAIALVALAGLSYAVQTLRLQSKRRRARRDPTFLYWQFGLCCALPALLMLLLAPLFPDWAADPRWPLVFGVLLGVGGVVSLITGMLYKILPFLAWLHLQDLGRARRKVPSMAQLLPERAMRQQFAMHVLTVSALLAAIFWPQHLAQLAGFVWAVSALFLFRNLLSAAWAYRQAETKIKNSAADTPPDRG